MFYETVRREASGRYTVHLPFQETTQVLGNSRWNAERRLLQMEKRFERNPEIYRQYKKFMEDYLKLGHMESVPEAENNAVNANYLFHHAVLKPESTSTKLCGVRRLYADVHW